MTFLCVVMSFKEIRDGTSLHRLDPGQSGSLCNRDCLHPHRSTLTLSSKYCMNYMCWVSCSKLTTTDKDRCSSPAQGPAKFRSPRWPYSLLYMSMIHRSGTTGLTVIPVKTVWRLMQYMLVCYWR